MGYKRNKKKNRQQGDGPSSSQPQGDDTDLKALLEGEYGVTAEEYESLLPYIPAAEALSNDDDDVTTALRALELAQMAEAVARKREAPVPPAEIHNQQLQKSQSEEPVSTDHQEPVSTDHQERSSSGSKKKKKRQQQQQQQQEQEQPQPQPRGDHEPPPPPLPSVPPATITPSAPLAAPIHYDNLKFFLETYYGVKPEEYDTLFPYITAANAMPSGSVPASAAPLVAAMKALALSSTAEAAARRGEPPLPPAAAAADSINYQELMGHTRIKKHSLQEQEPSLPRSLGFQPSPSSSSFLDLSISSPSVLTAARQHINQQSLLPSSSSFPFVPPPPVPSARPAPVDKNVPGTVRPAINMKALVETDFGVTRDKYINNLFTNIPPDGDPVILAAKAKNAAAMAESAKAALKAAIIQVLTRRETQQSMGQQKSKKKKQQLEKCNQQQLLQRKERQQEQEINTSSPSSCLSSSGPPIELVPFEFRSYSQQWMLLPSSSYLDLSSGFPFLPNSFSSSVFFEVHRENQNTSASSAAPHESGVRPADLVALVETYFRSGGPIYLTPKQYCALFPQIAALNEIRTTRAATETEMLAAAQAAEDAAYAALAEAQAARRGPPLLPGARALYAALFQEGSWPSGQLYFNPLMERTITMDRPQPCAAPAPSNVDHEDYDGHHDVDDEVGPGSSSAAGNSGGGDSSTAE